MSTLMKIAIVVILIAVVAFVTSYAGILGLITLSSQLQLLFQVIGVSIVVLGLTALAMFKLNRAVDQADKS